MSTLYDWYRVFNVVDFFVPHPDDGKSVILRTYTVVLEGRGEVTFIGSRGNMVGITYADVFLIPGLNDKSPFEFAGYATYRDPDGWVWFGFPAA